MKATGDKQYSCKWKYSHSNTIYEFSSSDESGLKIKFSLKIEKPQINKLFEDKLYFILKAEVLEPNNIQIHDLRTYFYDSKLNAIPFKNVIHESEELKAIECYNLNYDDVFILNKFFIEPKDKNISVLEKKLNYLEKQSLNYNNLLGHKHSSDILLKIGKEASKEKIPAHKLLLASQSPWFSTKLNEPRVNEIVINENFNHMKIVLNWMYSENPAENLDLNYNTAAKIVVLARKYEIATLQDYCHDILSDTMSVDNVFKLYEKASISDNEEMKSEALEFFWKNKNNITPEHYERLKSIDNDIVIKIFKYIVDKTCGKICPLHKKKVAD